MSVTMKSCVIVNILLMLMLSGASAKRFDTRCKLVRELLRGGLPKDLFLGQWVCLVEKESDRNTSAITEYTGGKKNYGLFQIPNRWCRIGRRGGDCNVTCESLIDDDIQDDISCAMVIFNREGFKYWPRWVTRCKNDKNSMEFYTTEIYKCPDLKFSRSNPERSASFNQRSRIRPNSSIRLRHMGLH